MKIVTFLPVYSIYIPFFKVNQNSYSNLKKIAQVVLTFLYVFS